MKLVGFGIAGTGFGVVLGVVAGQRLTESVSGVGIDDGRWQFGQVVGPPAQALQDSMHWSSGS